jgi:hypothetical protein
MLSRMLSRKARRSARSSKDQATRIEASVMARGVPKPAQPSGHRSAC